MNKFFILLLLSIPLFAEHIRWSSDYDTAHQKALKQNKMLMILLLEDNSKKSIKILHSSFNNQSYIKQINDKFVSVVIIKGQKQSYPIEMLYTMTYPALFFLDKEELFIGENLFGNLNPSSILKQLIN